MVAHGALVDHRIVRDHGLFLASGNHLNALHGMDAGVAEAADRLPPEATAHAPGPVLQHAQPCVRATSTMASMRQAAPWMCTGMIARVRAVMRWATSSGSSPNPWSASAKTGTAPKRSTASGDEMKFSAGIITSSPGPRPRAATATSKAPCPVTPRAWRWPSARTAPARRRHARGGRHAGVAGQGAGLQRSQHLRLLFLPHQPHAEEAGG